MKYHTTGDISTIQMEDGKGITISSEGNIEMLANNIVLFATEQVRMTAGKKIEMISGGSSIIIDGEDNRIDEKAGDIYLESPLNEETPVLTEDGGSLLLSEWGYERENVEFSLSREVYKLELVKAFRDQWKETSGEYTPEGDMPPLYQANKENPKSINDINFKNWLWREYHIKLEDIILLESQLNENLALALRHQNKIGITHTSDGIRITEENKCDPVIQKQIYEDWKKNSGQYDPKNDVIPEWEMDALHPRTVNDMKLEQYLLREYGMTRKEEIEKTFGGNIDALLKMSTIFDVFTLGTAAVAKLTGKKVWKEVGEEVGEKAVKTVAGETSEVLEKELVEGTTDDIAKTATEIEKNSITRTNKIPNNDSTTGHIFRNAEGHIPDTPENRNLLEDVANNSDNFLGFDKYGNEWYTQIQKDGTQVWVQARNGKIFEGGVNKIPKNWNPQTGLKKP